MHTVGPRKKAAHRDVVWRDAPGRLNLLATSESSCTLQSEKNNLQNLPNKYRKLY
jgi:hypothetical protein